MASVLAKGDRVRLKMEVARTMKIKHQTRVGTIVRVSKFTESVTILWDDRASVDQWPLRAIEPAPRES